MNLTFLLGMGLASDASMGWINWRSWRTYELFEITESCVLVSVLISRQKQIVYYIADMGGIFVEFLSFSASKYGAWSYNIWKILIVLSVVMDFWIDIGDINGDTQLVLNIYTSTDRVAQLLEALR
jgi:hypothetical protein